MGHFYSVFAIWLLGCISTPAHAQTTLRALVSGGSSNTATLSSITFGTLRTEFRLENFASSGSDRHIWGKGAFSNTNCKIAATTDIMICHFGGDGTPDGEAFIDLTGRTDVRFRWQRDPSGLTYKLETWDGDCSDYASMTKVITSPIAPDNYSGAFYVADSAMTLSFLRLYSTLDNSGACPVDAPTATADLIDYRFEDMSGTGTLADVSGHGFTLTAGGSSYAASTVYPPSAIITRSSTTYLPVYRATQALTLSGATSVAFTTNGTVSSYFWQQVGGTERCIFSSRTASSTSVTCPTKDQYTIRLTVADGNGLRASDDFDVGVVATDSNSVVITPNAEFQWVLGDVLAHGASDYPWYEATEAATADVLSAPMLTPPTSTVQPCTITIPSGSPNTLVGGLITASTYGNVAAVVSGCTVTGALDETRIVVHWDPDGDSSFRGRRVISVTDVPNSTTLVTNNFQLPHDPAKFSSAMAWGTLDTTFYPWNSLDGNSQGVYFYEAGLAVGRLYAKTGLAAYRTQFHAFCDNSWRWSLDSGWLTIVSRNSPLHAMLACATDSTYTAPAGLWDGIARATKAMALNMTTTSGQQPAYNPTADAVAGVPDVRENSYVLRATAILARYYGNHGGSTMTWCGYLENQLNHYWLATAKIPVGAPTSNYAYWGENLFLGNVTYVAASIPAGDLSFVFGTSPWRAAGLPNIALTYARDALADAAACNNTSLANSLFNPSGNTGLITNVGNFIWDYGRSHDGGSFFSTLYESDTGNRLGGTVFNDFPPNGRIDVVNGSTAVVGTTTYFTAQFGPCDGTTSIQIIATTYTVASCADDTHLTLGTTYAGATANINDYRNTATIAVTNGSQTVTGTGTKFQTLFAPCDGTTYIGIIGLAGQTDNVDRRVYQVTACASNTSLTINLPYAGPTESGRGWFSRASRALQSCGPQALSTLCEPDQYFGRNLSSDLGAHAAWLYRMSGSTTWRDRARFYTNKTFGGAAGGAGAIGAATGSSVYARPGTLAVISGSNAVAGTGTQFTQQFAPCDGTTRIVIAHSSGTTWAAPATTMPVYRDYAVTGCGSDTTLTLSANYGGATLSSIGMFYNPTDTQWQGADGSVGNMGDVLPPCSTNAPPCGGDALLTKYGKPLGMASGAGNTPVALADLKGGVLPLTTRTIVVSYKRASVSGATQGRVTLTRPDGSTDEVTCAADVCSVAADARQGDHLVRIEYLSSGDVVLARGEQQKVTVP